MVKQFIFSSNLPVSEHASESDPNHPKNVVRTSMIVGDQASADTKYDIIPPPRVEGFVNPSFHTITIIGSVLAVVLSLLILLRIQSTPLRIVIIVVLMASIHYLIHRLENRTV